MLQHSLPLSLSLHLSISISLQYTPLEIYMVRGGCGRAGGYVEVLRQSPTPPTTMTTPVVAMNIS